MTALSSQTVVVGSQAGLHARPAAVVVQEANKFAGDVTVANADGSEANLKSILAVMGLNINFGDEVTVSASGEGAEEAVDLLAKLIATELDH